MTQEVSKADSVVLDGGASQAAARMPYVRVDILNAQTCKAFLVGVKTEKGQELQRTLRAFGTRLRTQPTHISKPHVVAVYEITVKGFERCVTGPQPATFHAPDAAAY
jgi:hypothetical protein